MDIASIGGLLLAILGILGGMMMEGGSFAQIAQPTALLIVLAGTIGAVMVQFPLPILIAAIKQLVKVFFYKEEDGDTAIAQVVRFAVRARKSGLISLDEDLDEIEDPFFKKALMLAIDGSQSSEVLEIMQLEIENRAEFEERIPHVFESAGGFSPTIGIIGAVLGLIQVMQHLENIDAVGRGIAVAFVATIYGVGLANIVFLPVAGKLKIRNQEEHIRKMMLMQGVISILEGMNPRMIETKLRTFLSESKGPNPPKVTAASGREAYELSV